MKHSLNPDKKDINNLSGEIKNNALFDNESLRSQYRKENNISNYEAVNKPLIEMTGYIKYLENKISKIKQIAKSS